MNSPLKSIQTFVGIDVSKRSLSVVRLCDGEKLQRLTCKTDEAGIRTLINWLTKNDTVTIEAGSQSFRLARRIKEKVACEVIVLNPGDVATIYKSLKKTDKEDALKLARLAQRNPREELPEVEIPTDEQEAQRSLSTEQVHWKKMSTANINRLHGLFTQAGLTDISRGQLNRKSSRDAAVEIIPEQFKAQAKRLLGILDLIDQEINAIEQEIKNELKKNSEYCTLVMSMPGIGPVTSLALLGYLGQCERFSDARQVSFYVGLVPRVEISGTIKIYGHIIKRSTPIRRTIVQSAWALIRSEQGGELKEFFYRVAQRRGRKIAIVAVARKMMEVLYVMLKTGELYNAMDDRTLEKKLAGYGLL